MFLILSQREGSPSALEIAMLSYLENVYSYYQNLFHSIAISIFFPNSKMGVKILSYLFLGIAKCRYEIHTAC